MKCEFATPSRDDLAEVERLKERMLKMPFFLMTRTLLDPSKLVGAMLPHYRWMIELEKRGAVLLSGPLTGRDGAKGAGITVFRAASWDEAEAIASADPFVVAGAVSYELQIWQLNEGRITLSFDLSDQSGGLG